MTTATTLLSGPATFYAVRAWRRNGECYNDRILGAFETRREAESLVRSIDADIAHHNGARASLRRLLQDWEARNPGDEEGERVERARLEGLLGVRLYGADAEWVEIEEIPVAGSTPAWAAWAKFKKESEER